MPPELWSIWTGMRGQCCTPVGCTSSTPPTGQGQYQLAGSGEILLCTCTSCSYWEPLGGHQGNIVICTCIWRTEKHIYRKAPKKESRECCFIYMYWYVVCTCSSTIKHAFTKAPGTIQRILLHVFTICITLIHINFYYISPFHLSLCLSSEKIWFKKQYTCIFLHELDVIELRLFLR